MEHQIPHRTQFYADDGLLAGNTHLWCAFGKGCNSSEFQKLSTDMFYETWMYDKFLRFASFRRLLMQQKPRPAVGGNVPQQWTPTASRWRQHGVGGSLQSMMRKERRFGRVDLSLDWCAGAYEHV